MKHDVLRHSTFFSHMEEFGYFHGLESILPPDFTAVFEIARVLEDESSSLATALSSVLTISPANIPPKNNSREWKPNRDVGLHEEYEAALIRSVSDITRILPHQYLLPDEVFMERLARRSLWINLPLTPVTLAYKSASTDYAPNNFKQKVYLLLDTSASMSSHHRIQMAKAIVYVFLKQNLKELGHIYLRTFDIELGPLQRATDDRSLRHLIHYAMRIARLGNGTVMERAILQATEDIRAHASLSGAEILIVTDGAIHLDSEKIRKAIGNSIRINTVKIGNAEAVPDERALRDIASTDDSPHGRELQKLEEELRRAQHDLTYASSDAERRRAQSRVNALDAHAQKTREQIYEHLKLDFGKEIIGLSSVYVNVDDITADQIFTLQQSEIDEVRQLLAEVESDFEEGVDADSLREAALLYEHVKMLLNSMAHGNEEHKQLESFSQRLQELLKDVLHAGQQDVSRMRGIARGDMHDLHMILGAEAGEGDSLAALILSLLKRLASRIFQRS